MWAFELLGLPADADERSIKRAYAQRLRGARPDEDPTGFQRLRDAYELALRLCRHRAEAEKAVEPEAPETVEAETAQAYAQTQEHPDDAPAAATWNLSVLLSSRPHMAATVPRAQSQLPAATVDLERLLDELLGVAAHGDPQALLSWLGSRHELWSLQAKAELGRRLMARLHQHAMAQHSMVQQPMAHHPAAMSGECFDALLSFFDLDHVQAGYDPFALQRLRRRMRIAWELQPEHVEHLARRTQDPPLPGDAPNVRLTRKLLAQLTRPFRWWQVPVVAVRPKRPGQLADFIMRLSEGHPNELLGYLQEAQLRFWLTAAERQPSLERLAINAIRIVSAALCSLWVMASLFLAITLAGGSADKAWEAFPAIAAWIAGIAGLAFAYLGWQWLDYWQRQPESPGLGSAWLRWACIPLIALAGVALKYGGAGDLAGDLVVILAIVLAVRRYRERSGAGPFPIRMHPIGWIVAINVLRGLLASEGVADLPLVEFGACIALGLWAADAWKERGRRQLRGAAA